jgi:peptide/nickel transport system permease protein
MREGLRSLVHRRLALFAAVLLVIMVGATLAAPLITSTGPNESDVANRLLGPAFSRPFGTDNLGRDVFARTLYGGRTSMIIGLAVVTLALTSGVALGLVTGYYSRIDMIVMRVVDGLMSFPALILAVAMVGVLGASITTLVVALAIVYTPRVVRIVRASVLVAKEQPFVESAISLGARDIYLLRRHVLPNVMSPIIVQASFVFSYAVLAEAALSFLGVGVPADTPSWGNVLTDARAYMEDAWWISVFPGIAIMVMVLCMTILGDHLRDELDPRLASSLSLDAG